MKRFKNILLVNEAGVRGRKARNRAVDLALRNDARLKLVEVAEPLPPEGRVYRAGDVEVDLRTLVAREREERLGRVAGRIRGSGVRIATEVLFGSPHLAISREVRTGGHDLVLLTAEGDGGLGRHLFGSTSRHLLRKCPCPVWVVRPARRRKRFRVLAAVNAAEPHPSALDLARTILEMSSSLARMYDGELDIVYAWRPAPPSVRVQRDVVARWNAELFVAAEEKLAEMLAGHDLIDLGPRIHLPSGPAGLRIAEVAAERRSDVVVMGTLSRTGLRGLLIGNTAETVLQHIDASVLAVKPAGFESPLDL